MKAVLKGIILGACIYLFGLLGILMFAGGAVLLNKLNQRRMK